MALPKLTTPTYELDLPSTGEKIKFRPFLVKEQKLLMGAALIPDKPIYRKLDDKEYYVYFSKETVKNFYEDAKSSGFKI